MSQYKIDYLTARFNAICSQHDIRSIDELKAFVMHHPTNDIMEAYSIYMTLTSLL